MLEPPMSALAPTPATAVACAVKPPYVPVSMPANLLVLVNTPQTIAEPVVKPTSTPIMVIVPV